MGSSNFSRRAARVAVAAFLAGAGLAAFGPAARAADDGQGTIMGSLMNIVGLSNKPQVAQPKIDYRDRGPLVLPSSADLPAPAASAAANNPAWPKDPDALAARRAQAEALAPAQPVDRDARMSFRDMAKDRRTNPSDDSMQASGCADDSSCDPHKLWAQLRVKKGDPGAIAGDGPKMVVGQEPKREYLTEPPTGYRLATQTVKPTWEAKRDQDADQNPAVYLLHQKGQVAGTD